MKIRMKTDVSGNRDGQPWPKRGEVVDLPDDEATEMCETGMAEPASKDDDVETRPDDRPAEKRTALTTQSASALVPNEGSQDAGSSGDSGDAAGGDGDGDGGDKPAAAAAGPAPAPAKKATPAAAKKTAAAKPADSK